ncbi:hypothetical protein ACT3SP_14445 [Brachybacterium sp. AOP43-C2-M15]|uniref:hypothetical protein n=1 Tax=Brachybacterium sp. AOP43-C2-M15 TaxID=3457661 RepID=UPI004033FBE3
MDSAQRTASGASATASVPSCQSASRSTVWGALRRLAVQLALAADNLERVLREDDMPLAHLVRLNAHAIDVDALMDHDGALAGSLGAAGAAPTITMLGVVRLAIPDQVVELDEVAVGERRGALFSPGRRAD